MRAQFILEWKLFTHNIKNQILFFLFLLLALYAAFIIEPSYTPWRSVDEAIYQAEIENAEAFLSENEEFSNPRMYEMFSNLIESNTQLLDAIEREDWNQVLEEEENHYLNFVKLRYGEGGAYRDPYFYSYDELSYISDLRQSYTEGYTTKRYQDYQVSDLPLSRSIIEERTVIQTILRYMQGWLPATLIILAILYAGDITPKDKKHPSLVQNIPLSTYQASWVKSSVVLSAYLLTVITGFLLFSIPAALKNGFGSMNLPIPVYGWSYSLGDIWISSTIGAMFFQSILLLFLITLIFIRAMAFINIFLSNSFVNLLFVPVVFVSNLWHSPGKTYVHSQYNYFPATYFRVGEALTGQLNHLYLSNLISFGTGLIVLLASFLIIEFLNMIGLKSRRYFKRSKR